MKPHKTLINIGDIIVSIESLLAPSDEDPGRFRYRSFIIDSCARKPDIAVALKVIPRYERFEMTEFFRSERDAYNGISGPGEEHERRRLSQEEKKYLGKGLDWRIGKSGGKILIEGGSAGRFQLLMRKDLSRGELLVVNPEGGWKVKDVIYGFLQILIIYYMAKRRTGILFHSAGVFEGIHGYIFAGLSRAGKSTTSRIWDAFPGIAILNDDRVIVRKYGNGFYMHPTPWHGDYSDYLAENPPGKVKLSKMFYICHGEENLAERTGRVEGINLFFQTIFLPFWDCECINFAFDFLFELVDQKPCYKFAFKNDDRIVSYVRNLE